MRLKVPVFKAASAGLRRISTHERMKDALNTLEGRARIRRTMWSRRAQEYELKINSGDPVSIAEVLRDLKRRNAESEQSNSERLAREVAALESITEEQASLRLEEIMGVPQLLNEIEMLANANANVEADVDTEVEQEKEAA